MKKIIKELYPYVIIVVVVVLIRTFIITPVRVDGESMSSTLDNGNILLLNKLDKKYKRFDIVVLNKGNSKLIKRVIGLPGDYVEYKDNDLYINGELIDDPYTTRTNDFTLEELYNIDRIPKGYYFVMGDNRLHSLDSRSYEVGLVSEERIKGTVCIRLFPFSKFGKVQ